MQRENLIDKILFFIFIFFQVFFSYFIILFLFIFIKNNLDFNKTTKWIIELYDFNLFYYYFFTFLTLLSEEARTFDNILFGLISLVCWVIICIFFYTIFIRKN